MSRRTPSLSTRAHALPTDAAPTPAGPVPPTAPTARAGGRHSPRQRSRPARARAGGVRAALRSALAALALAVVSAALAQAGAGQTGGTAQDASPPAAQQPSSGQDGQSAQPSGGSGGTGSGGASSEASSAGLMVWTTYQGAPLAWLKDEAAAFEQAFDKPVTITPLKLGEIKQRTMLGAKKGDAADVLVGVPHDQFSALADAGVLADMSDYATQRYLSDLNAQAARAFRYRGTLYGLPLSARGPALIINTDLVKKAPATYADLVKLAASLTGDGRYGFAVDAGNFYYAYGWLRTFGGYVFGTDAQGNVDTGDLGLASAGAVKGLRELKALRFQDGLLPDDTSYAALQKLFLAGKLAMLYDGPWEIPAISRAGIPVAVRPMPPLADGTPWHSLMNVDGVLVNHYSADPVGAANLAKYLTQVDAQVALARRAGSIPVSSLALRRVEDDPVLHGFGQALEHAVAIPNVPAMGAVWGPMDDALGSILGGSGSDVEAVLERAAAAVGTP